MVLGLHFRARFNCFLHLHFAFLRMFFGKSSRGRPVQQQHGRRCIVDLLLHRNEVQHWSGYIMVIVASSASVVGLLRTGRFLEMQWIRLQRFAWPEANQLYAVGLSISHSGNPKKGFAICTFVESSLLRMPSHYDVAMHSTSADVRRVSCTCKRAAAHVWSHRMRYRRF